MEPRNRRQRITKTTIGEWFGFVVLICVVVAVVPTGRRQGWRLERCNALYSAARTHADSVVVDLLPANPTTRGGGINCRTARFEAPARRGWWHW